MTLPLVMFLVAAVVPVFFGKIRSMPFWLAVQALALGWSGVAQHGDVSMHTLVALLEGLVVRAAVAPLLLRRAIGRRAEPNLDLMPSNLFTWAIAITLIVLAFEFGAPAMTDRQALALGVVGATVAVALLLLSTNNSPPAQLVAVLFMENALALFESLLPEPWPLPVHTALSAIYLLTVGVGSWLIGAPDVTAVTAQAAAQERT
jgi:hydrogenase-4 membrane subunit HyfE